MKTKICIFATLLATGLINSHAQDTWIQKADFGGIARFGAAGFAIGSKGYLGTGNDYNNRYNDFWEYDTSTDAWVQKAGTVVVSWVRVGFSIGSKGYIGTGWDGSYTNTFFEYDSTTNSWTQKANFRGTARQFAVGFSIGSKGYIGTGGGSFPTKDFWEYDPSTNVWTRKADFGGVARSNAVGFSIGSKGYIGTGNDDVSFYRDFWEYDPSTNAWTQKADFGGTARTRAVGFAIGSKGYLGTGNDVLNGNGFRKDFWEYDPAANTWTQRADFGGAARFFATGFSIGNKGYVGTGWDLVVNYKDFWEYTPATAEPNPVPLISQPLVPDAIAPGGAGFTLTVNGTGFVSGSVVNWNGSARATTFVSGSHLTTSILASDIASASTASVSVVNPSPGGGISNTIFFPITTSTSDVRLNRSDFATNVGPESLAAGDFRRDGNLSLAVTNQNASNVSILIGNGDGTFQPRVDYATGNLPVSVTVAELNDDNIPDLAIRNQGSGTISVLLGNGDGTFQSASNFATGAGYGRLSVGDFNGDGKLDLITTNYDDDTVSILLGNGNGTFLEHVDYATGSVPLSLAVGDFNGDNKLDLITGNIGSNTFSILLGNGDGTFRPSVDYSTIMNPQSIVLADFDGDHKLDLAIFSEVNEGDTGLSILLGNGDGTFRSFADYATGCGPDASDCTAAVADLNGDGHLDLAAHNSSNNTVFILLGNGDGTFQSAVAFETGEFPNQVVSGDFNADGRLDLAVAAANGNAVSILLQATNVSVFATGLEYPRGLKFGPDGQLYVAEAGSGGTMSTDGLCDQVIPPVGPYLGGFTARISKVASDGTVKTVADNLPSGINALGDVLGIADVAFIGRTLYALSAGGGCSHGFANDDAAILRVNPDGTTKSIADLSVFQKAHPVKNPNPLDFEPDGSWYSMITVGNLIHAVEPNHGELDLIHTDGRIRRIIDISASYNHIVPTALAYDGVNFYVGNLGTFPIVDGSQVILKITPNGKVKTFATGFTTILGLAFDSHGKLYVLENTTGGNEYPTPGTGKILRLSSDGTPTEIATGLNLPTAMTFGADGNIYVSSWGFGPPAMGEIDKVTLPR